MANVLFVGSSVKHILITRNTARRKTAPVYLTRGQAQKLNALITRDEEDWEAEQQGWEITDDASGRNGANVQSFEDYRSKGQAAGVM